MFARAFFVSAPTTVSQVLREILDGDRLSMVQAAKKIPSFRGGRPTSPATLSRWVSDGVRLPTGETVRMEAERVGGRWVTSTAALARFIARQSEAWRVQAPAATRTVNRRERQAAKTSRVLDQLGY